MAVLACAAGCKKAPPAPPPPPAVRVVPVTARSVEQTREWLATIDGSTNAEIRPQVTGYIKSVDYREGSVVQTGALLFTLDRRPFAASVDKARGDSASAEAQLQKARADVARAEPLVAAGVVSQQELDNARASVRAAEAQVQSMRGMLSTARLNLEWAEVRSPIPGIAGIAQTRVGSLVNSTQVLTVVSTLDPIRASMKLSQQEYLRYAELLNHANDPQYRDRRYLELILLDGSVHPHGARSVIVNRQIDPATGTLTVQTLFPNPGNLLRPGMFGKVRVRTGTPATTLLIPEVAVQELQGQTRVAVVGAGDKVELRPVRLGRLIEHEYVIEGGLREGERVIVEGLQGAQPGVRVTALPAPPSAPAASSSQPQRQQAPLSPTPPTPPTPPNPDRRSVSGREGGGE